MEWEGGQKWGDDDESSCECGKHGKQNAEIHNEGERYQGDEQDDSDTGSVVRGSGSGTKLDLTFLGSFSGGVPILPDSPFSPTDSKFGLEDEYMEEDRPDGMSHEENPEEYLESQNHHQSSVEEDCSNVPVLLDVAQDEPDCEDDFDFGTIPILCVTTPDQIVESGTERCKEPQEQSFNKQISEQDSLMSEEATVSELDKVAEPTSENLVLFSVASALTSTQALQNADSSPPQSPSTFHPTEEIQVSPPLHPQLQQPSPTLLPIQSPQLQPPFETSSSPSYEDEEPEFSPIDKQDTQHQTPSSPEDTSFHGWIFGLVEGISRLRWF